MALFKISKGLSKNLMTNVPYAKEGFAYFTSDDGKFYIDIDGDGTNASPAVIGDNRIPLSALSTDWIKATKIEDTETYPILAFKVADNTKNLIELKYGSIGYKDGTLVIPNVETGSKDEVLIENNDEGSALIIDNKGAGTGIKIINTGEESLVNNWGININNNILLNMNGSASFEGNVVIGGTHIFKGDAANILGTNKTNTIISNQLTLQQGAVFGGTAQNAGLVTRGIYGISEPTDDGACEKDNLYINYDGDNSYKASRHVILQAGEAGENYGNNLYQYAAARGDAVHDWSLNNFYIKSDIDKKLNNLLATNDAMVFKGTIGGDAAATIHELPAKHNAGETYRVYDIKGGNNGKYLGNGEVCEIGDLIICIKDGTTHSAGDWTIVQTNIDGAVINTDESSTDGHIAIFSGNKGRTIKDSGKSFNDLAVANHTHTKLVNDKQAVDFNGASLSPINNSKEPLNISIDLGNTSNPWQNLYLTSDIKFKDSSGNWKTLTEKLADKSNVDHKHTIADTDGLQTALDNKSNTGHTHTISNIIDLQKTLDDKAAKLHNHEISDITNLQKTLNSKSDTGHKHKIADINKLQAALDGKSDTGHTHQITANVDTSNSKEDALIKLEGTGGINTVSYKATHADKGPSMADNVSSITTTSNANKSLVGEFGKTLTLNIPRITIDKQGHVNTAINDEVSIALPSAPTIGNGKLTIKVGKMPVKVNETFTANQTTDKDIPLPVYTITETDTLLSGKSNSGHTHDYAGSSSAGGPATSADKLNTNAGSENAPVYFKNGIPIVTGQTLDRDINGNAKTATIARKVEHALSISVGGTPKGSYDGSAVRTIDVNAADLKISGALVYIGRVATKPTSSQVTLIDGTTVTAVAGNVVICTGDKKEYLYDIDGNWVDLGSSTSYALKPHIHGNISSDGYLTNEAGVVQTNSIVYSDADGKITKGPTFDTTNTTKRFLAENGNWEQSSHHTSGSWSGLTYTAKSVNNAGELKFTIPTGTGATSVALGNHNHDKVYKKIQTAVPSPAASNEDISFIDTVSQDTQGKITATKKTVRDASASQSGVVSTGTQTFAGEKTLNDKTHFSKGFDLKTNSGSAQFNASTVNVPNGTDYVDLYVSTVGDGNGDKTKPLVLNANANGSGNVGIGITQPTEKLEVNGNVKATQFKGNADTADKWKTPRTFTIGTAKKTVDGSSNVSWTLNELGVAAGNHNHDSLYVKKSGDTMTGLLKTNGSIENQGEAKFTHPDYCPDIENTAENIGCAFKASRGHFNQMNVNEIYLPATTTTNYEGNKISFKTYSGGNNGTYANVSEVAQINTTGLKVGSSSIGINGYIEGTWLKTTNAGNKAGDFATIDGYGWIYKRTAAQVLSDIGAAASSHNHDSNYVKKTGDTMTGQLAVDKAGQGFRVNNGSTGYIELSRDNGGAQLYGLWDCIKTQWIVQSDGTNVYFHGNADSASKTLGDINGLQIDTNYLKLSGGTMNGSINCSLPATTSTATNTGAMICHRLAGGNNGMYVGNGDADGSILGTTGKANLIFKSWQSIGFVDGCSSTNAGMTMTINTRTGVLRGNKLWGAVWNDYAEFREGDTIESGKCVIEVGDDTLITSTERMMPGANITSDTFGFAIGETEQAKTPIAVSGRVLAYPYESHEEFKKNIGRPVCSGPNGTVSIMTDEEYKNKGYCAIGTISAVPDYEEWGTGKVKVNGRVWIKVF